MIATVAFVVGFVILGIGVVLIAMRGGPRGAREAMHTQTPRGRLTTTMIVIGLGLIFGVGIPAAVLASSGQNKDAPGGVQLPADQDKAGELFVKNCGTCQTLAAAGTAGRVGPNFDELRPPKALV